MKAQYITEQWAAAKTAAINSMAAVRAAKTAAQDRIKSVCGQDAWGGAYVHPWSATYDHLTYQIWISQYTPDCHWDCTLKQVEALPALLAPWTMPERWEARWAKQQKDL